MNLREALNGKLNRKEKEELVTSFDIIGDIAIIQIPARLIKKEKTIAKEILKLHKNIRVVAKEIGPHSGEFRLQKVKIIAGAKRKETEYKESGTRMKLNVEKTYFSPRFGTERLRIASLVSSREDVLVMFSGVAPFPLVIAKNSKASLIYGVEINPDAHKYAVENVKLNKMDSRIKLFLGDVRAVVPKLGMKFDRVVMPLPQRGEEFLDVALAAVKKKGFIHFYDFLHEDEFDKGKAKVKKACKLAKRKFRMIGVNKCGQQSPRVYRVCFDVKIL